MDKRAEAKLNIQIALNELMYEKGELDYETFQLANIALLERLTANRRGNKM